MVEFRVMLNSVKLDGRTFYAKIWIWPCLDCITRLNHILNHINNQSQTHNWMLTIRNPRLNLDCIIFDKSNPVRSKTKDCKNHSHTLKLKNSEILFLNSWWNLGYMSLNSSWKINPNGSILVDWFDPLTKLTQKP
jgi:hypothetical protein